LVSLVTDMPNEDDLAEALREANIQGAARERMRRLFTDVDVTLAVEAIGQVIGGFRVRWYREPFEGWDAMLEPDVDCFCKGGSCYCCDGASVTREQVDALRRIGVEVVE
jgi:hypothetical protein